VVNSIFLFTIFNKYSYETTPFVGNINKIHFFYIHCVINLPDQYYNEFKSVQFIYILSQNSTTKENLKLLFET
jgi:hypothetical protein